MAALLALPVLYSLWRNFQTIRSVRCYRCRVARYTNKLTPYVCMQLSRIPTVGGPAIPVLDFIGAIRYLMHSDVVLWEGYQKVCLFIRQI